MLANYSTIELLGLLGGTGCRAVAADYDGDNLADPAIYGESNGVWVFKISSANYLAIILTQSLGGTGYIPVPADYDGDGLADPAVYLPAVLPDARSAIGMQAGQQASGAWYIWLSSAGYFPLGPVTFSTTEDHIAVPADYDGDGICDPAAYVPSLGKWRIWMSGSGYALTEMELK